MLDDDQEYQGPAESGPSWAPRSANGGNMTPLGPAHLLSTRPPALPPEMRSPNGGGRAYSPPPAQPGINAGGASAFALGSTSAGNGGSPNVQPQAYSPFGNYSGTPQAPRHANIPTGSPAPMQSPRSGALDDFLARHAPQQGGGGQQGGGPQQQGGADEDEAEGAGAAEGASAAEAGEAGAEAGGAEVAALFL